MSVPLHRQVKPGTLVSIVLKQDQRTGRQVQGTVKDVLTRHDHPRGIKVRLGDGRIGRVQSLVGGNNATAAQIANPGGVAGQRYYRTTMADNNPWANTQSQGNSYGQNEIPYQPPQGPPPGQRQQSGGTAQSFYNADPHAEQAYSDPQSNPWGGVPSAGAPSLPPRNPAHAYSQQDYSQQSYGQQQQHQPQHSVQRSDTDTLVADQADRAEQVEHLQHYESMAAGHLSQDDRNRQQLEKEFPSVDGSLIAALYGDSKNMAETRELLQELARE